MTRSALLVPLLLLGTALPAAGGDIVAGPVETRVVRVVDGDTFVAEAMVWPRHWVRVTVRIRGIDAPELRSRCAAERTAAERAREALSHLLGDGPVAVGNIGGDKYYGRVLADVTGAGGRAVGPAMLGLGAARAYGDKTGQKMC